MKKLLIVTPYALDANSYWRCMGPLGYLAKNSHEEIEITLANTQMGISWVEVSQFDAVFLHRPCRQDDLTVMQIAYNLGVPTWVDYDDWLFDLPIWNPHKNLYEDPKLQSVMAQCIVCADIVSVTTNELAQLFKKINPNVVILPNAYRSDIYRYRTRDIAPRNAFGYWRGTNTHDGDLISVRDGFQEIQHPIEFIGNPFWLVHGWMKPNLMRVKKSMDVILFNHYLWEIRPKFMIFPLFDCLFNRCKSNIAYIEALHAGAICIAPDLPEWNREGVITYKPHDSNEFVKAIDAAMSIPEEEHEKLISSAFESMKMSYDIPVVNELRKQIMYSITSPGFKKNMNNPFDQGLGIQALAYFQEVKKQSHGKTEKQD